MLSLVNRYSLFCIVVPVIISCDSLTNIARPFILSDEEEIKLGNKFQTQINADTVNYPPYRKSQEVIDYINRMGQKIAQEQQDRPDLSFTFTIVAQDSVINAFAIPGGHVFIYTGLLKAAESGAEVAGVIAHEIGHIAKYHSANSMVKQYGLSLINQIIFGSDSSAAAGIANILGGILSLKFSRDNEFEADSCAVSYTIAANYNPYGIKRFFELLVDRYGTTSGVFEALSTHPDTQKRIEEVIRIIKANPNAPADDGETNMYVTEFAAIKAKI